MMRNQGIRRAVSLLLTLCMALSLLTPAIAVTAESGGGRTGVTEEAPPQVTPTPTESPEPTPEPTPEVTPEPTPEVTPEPTPEPTPAHPVCNICGEAHAEGECGLAETYAQVTPPLSDFTYALDSANKTIALSKYKGAATELYIPATYVSGGVTYKTQLTGDVFYNNKVLTSIVFQSGVAFVGSMRKAFGNCASLTTLNMRGVDTSNVTSMSSVFYNCSSLTTLDLSGFNTSNVTDMSYMFNGCSKLTTLDLSSFDTSNVTMMSNVFSACNSLTTLDVSSFDTSKVTDMSGMFQSCSHLTTLDVSSFNTSNVTSMSSVFYNCIGLTTLDVSSFNTSNVTSMNSMFYECSSLTTLDLSGFDTSKVTSMSYMFSDCKALTTLNVSSFNTSNVASMGGMFNGCSKLTTLDLSGFDTSKVTSMSAMFQNCNALTTLDLSGFNTSNVTAMTAMFNRCSSLTTLDLSGFNTSNVASMGAMFQACPSLTTLDVSGFNTSNATTMGQMFYGCNALTTLDVRGFDTSKVTAMGSMFYGCSSLTTLDVSGFDTSKLTNMGQMFDGCSKLTTLDLSSFDTSKVTTLSAMFRDCSGLTTLDLSNFTINKGVGVNGFFGETSALKSVILPRYIDSSISIGVTANKWTYWGKGASTGTLYTGTALPTGSAGGTLVQGSGVLTSTSTSGTAKVGNGLSVYRIMPSSATVSYQWQRSTTKGGSAFSNIYAATGSSYTLTAADGGYSVRLKVTGTGAYAGTYVHSDAVTVANAAQTAPTVKPTVARQSATTLTPNTVSGQEYAVNTSATVAPTTGYVTTGTFTGLNAANTYYLWTRKAAYQGYDASSAIASAPIGLLQSLTGVTVSGNAYPGGVLTAAVAPAAAATSGMVTYQWYYVSGEARTPIAGATGKTYTLSFEDMNKTIVCDAKGKTDYKDTVSSNKITAQTSLSVTTAPTLTSYLAGERLDLTGMAFTYNGQAYQLVAQPSAQAAGAKQVTLAEMLKPRAEGGLGFTISTAGVQASGGVIRVFLEANGKALSFTDSTGKAMSTSALTVADLATISLDADTVTGMRRSYIQNVPFDFTSTENVFYANVIDGSSNRLRIPFADFERYGIEITVNDVAVKPSDKTTWTADAAKHNGGVKLTTANGRNVAPAVIIAVAPLTVDKLVPGTVSGGSFTPDSEGAVYPITYVSEQKLDLDGIAVKVQHNNTPYDDYFVAYDAESNGFTSPNGTFVWVLRDEKGDTEVHHNDFVKTAWNGKHLVLKFTSLSAFSAGQTCELDLGALSVTRATVETAAIKTVPKLTYVDGTKVDFKNLEVNVWFQGQADVRVLTYPELAEYDIEVYYANGTNPDGSERRVTAGTMLNWSDHTKQFRFYFGGQSMDTGMNIEITRNRLKELKLFNVNAVGGRGTQITSASELVYQKDQTFEESKYYVELIYENGTTVEVNLAKPDTVPDLKLSDGSADGRTYADLLTFTLADATGSTSLANHGQALKLSYLFEDSTIPNTGARSDAGALAFGENGYGSYGKFVIQRETQPIQNLEAKPDYVDGGHRIALTWNAPADSAEGVAANGYDEILIYNIYEVTSNGATPIGTKSASDQTDGKYTFVVGRDNIADMGLVGQGTYHFYVLPVNRYTTDHLNAYVKENIFDTDAGKAQNTGLVAQIKCLTLYTPTIKPQNVATTATIDSGSVDVTWTIPTVTEENVPEGVTGYNIYVAERNNVKGKLVKSISGPATLSCTLTRDELEAVGVKDGTAYYMQVTICNKVGESSFTTGTQPFILLSRPSAVRNLHATSMASTSISFSWDEPANLGGGVVDGYTVAYQSIIDNGDGSESLGTEQTTIVTDTTARLSGLTANTRYRVSVWANTVEYSGQVAHIEAATTSVPAAPTGLTVVPTLGADSVQSLRFDWSDAGNTGIEYYTLYAYEAADTGCSGMPRIRKLTGNALNATYVIGSDNWLETGNTYHFKVAAVKLVNETPLTGARSNAYTAEADAVTDLSLDESKNTALTLSYVAGQKLNLSGLTVTLHYSSGKTTDVAYANFAAHNLSAVFAGSMSHGDTLTTAVSGQKIKVNYDLASIKYSEEYAAPVTVSTRVAEHIEVVQTPRTNYIEDETLQLSSLKVRLKYNDGSYSESIIYADMASNGISVSYNGETVTGATKLVYGVSRVEFASGAAVGAFTGLNIAAKSLRTVSIETMPRTRYMVGTPFSLKGLKLSVTYNNGLKEIVAYEDMAAKGFAVTTVLPTGGEDIQESDFNKSVTLQVVYTNAAAATSTAPDLSTDPLTKSEGIITTIKSINWTKKSYVEGERLNLNGLTLEVGFEDGVSTSTYTLSQAIDSAGFKFSFGATAAEATEEYPLSEYAEYVMKTDLRDKKLFISYEGNESDSKVTSTDATQTQTVAIASIVTLSLNMPTAIKQLDYVEGETIDLSGLRVNFQYDGGSGLQVPLLSEMGKYSIYAYLVKAGEAPVRIDGTTLAANLATQDGWNIVIRSDTNASFVNNLDASGAAQKPLHIVPRRVDSIANAAASFKTSYQENEKLGFKKLVDGVEGNENLRFSVTFNDGKAEQLTYAELAALGVAFTLKPNVELVMYRNSTDASGKLYLTATFDTQTRTETVATSKTDELTQFTLVKQHLDKAELQAAPYGASAYDGGTLSLAGIVLLQKYNFALAVNNGSAEKMLTEADVLALLEAGKGTADEEYGLYVDSNTGKRIEVKNGKIVTPMVYADAGKQLVLYCDGTAVQLGAITITANDVRSISVAADTAQKTHYVLGESLSLDGLAVNYAYLNGNNGTVRFGGANFWDIVKDIKIATSTSDSAPLVTITKETDLATVKLTKEMNGKVLVLTNKCDNASFTTAVATAAMDVEYLPAAPVITGATAGADKNGTLGHRSTAALTWTADNGNGTIKGFQIYVDNAATPITVMVGDPALTLTAGTYGYTVTGLADSSTAAAPDKTHSFTVATINAAGESAKSTDIGTTSWTAPYAQVPYVTANEEMGTIVWAASTGGISFGTLLGYRVTASKADGGAVVYDRMVSADTLSIDASSNYFETGVMYNISVAQENEVGPGRARTTVATFSAVKQTAPDAPLNVAAAAADGKLTISWSASTGATGYKVTATDGTNAVPAGSISVNGTTATITGLTNGTEYTVSVVASNAIGDSAAAKVKGTPEAPVLTGIAITTQPTKTQYTVGDHFDDTGMVVTASYSDGSSKVLSAGEYTVDKTEALTLTDTTVTVAYQGKTATVSITVSEAVTGVTVSGSFSFNGGTVPALDGITDGIIHKVGDANVTNAGYTIETVVGKKAGANGLTDDTERNAVTFTVTKEGDTKASISITLYDMSTEQKLDLSGVAIKLSAKILEEKIMSFEISGVKDGAYQVVVGKKNHTTGTIKNLTIASGDVTISQLLNLLTGDLDGDGQISLQDKGALAEKFGQNNLELDLNDDGVITLQDKGALVESFGAKAMVINAQ